MAKIFSEDNALLLAEKLLQNDKKIKTELEEKINSITVSGGNHDIDLSEYATKNDLEEYAYKNHEHEQYLTEHQDLSDYAKTSDIPDISNLASTEYVDNAVQNVNVNLDGYATEEYVTSKINEASLSGEEIDLSDYALKSEIPTDYLSSIPDEYVTEIEMNAAIANAQLSGGEVNLNSYYTKDETYSKTEIDDAINNAQLSGADGKSAYEVALNNGFEGTEEEWLESLKGADSVAREECVCKIIAHRGYHVNSCQNTIAAFKEAVADGFKYLEIDIRRTADNMYVLSHDDIITLYNDGVATSVTISKSNYPDIKSYTWDADGEYIINTLQALFNCMKVYDVVLICDRKNGSNAEIIELANLCGVTDRLILSYDSVGNAISDSKLLNKYDNVPIRVIPSDFANLEELAKNISNPIYADINASMPIHYSSYLNYAFTAGMPILFAGCTLSNKNIWAQVASGCMANDDDNISYAGFKEALTGNYDVVSDLAVSKQAYEVGLTDVISITASNTIEGVSGNIYAYSKNPIVAEVVQTQFGNSVLISVTPKMTGETTIVIFDGVGGIVQIPITITDSAAVEPTIGVQTNAMFVIGGSINGTDLKAYANAPRMIGAATTGTYPLQEGNELWNGTCFPFEVPEGATRLVITCEGYIPGLLCMNYDSDSSYYTKVNDSGWLTADSATYDLTSVSCKYIVINFKNISNSKIDNDEDTSGIVIEFV